MKQFWGDTSTKVLIVVAIVVGLVLVLYSIHVLLVPFVGAAFVAYLIEPAIEILQRRGIQRGTGFLLLLGGTMVAIALLVVFPPAWLRLESIRGSGQNLTERIQSHMAEIEHSIDGRVPLIRSVNIGERITTRAADFAGKLFEELPSIVASFAANLLLVPLIAFFIIRDGQTMRRRIVDLVPNRYFEMTLMMFYRIDQQIGGYLRGRLIECSLVSVTMIISLGIAQLFVPLNQIFLISIVCGATNLIPYVGPLLGLAFGALLYLGAGLPLASISALLIAAVVAHLIDNVFIAPAVISHNVDLHPLTAALVLVIGGEALGVLGLIIAIPVAASLKVIAQEFYGNYRLHVR